MRALLCLARLALSSGLTLRMGPFKAIAIFGGTGGVGRECVYQALKDGNNVVILARDPSKLLTPERVTGSGGASITDPKLHVIQGNVCEAADVNKVSSSSLSLYVVASSHASLTFHHLPHLHRSTSTLPPRPPLRCKALSWRLEARPRTWARQCSLTAPQTSSRP